MIEGEVRGKINSYFAGSTVDGPGLRFVVFLQGCPLRCIYCHNPETWDISGGFSASGREVAEKAHGYLPYFQNGGGITLSGGEPLLQPDFAIDVLTHCRQAGIHTVLDTSGSIVDRHTEEILSLCDMVLLDIKFTDSSSYRCHTGADYETVLSFLSLAQNANTPVRLRQVVIPGFHDNAANIQLLKGLAARHSCVQQIELLPFLKLCLEKYNALGLSFPLKETPALSDESLDCLNRIIFL